MTDVPAHSIFAIAAPALLAAFAAMSAEPPHPTHDQGANWNSPAVQASPAATAIAPDFRRQDLHGHTLRLSDFRGKVVLLNFWATWCEPCLAEIQTFSRWQQEHGTDGLQVLGVSMDDDSAEVVAAVRKYNVAYPVVMGDEQLGNLYGGVLGLPLSYVIDSSGRIVARYQGEIRLADLEGRLLALLPRGQR